MLYFSLTKLTSILQKQQTAFAINFSSEKDFQVSTKHKVWLTDVFDSAAS